MFSGIVEEIGMISVFSNGSIEIQAEKVIEDLKIGDSVAVNGCCLTATEIKKNSWCATIVPETFRRIAPLKEGMPVNLERSLIYGGRVGGHLIQGHVDGIGEIQSKTPLSDGSFEVEIATTPSLLRYMIKKGSIAVDGVSLTLMDVNQNNFSFAMIPHTTEVTVLGRKEVGDCVNIEVDLLAKYCEKLWKSF